MEEPSVVDRFGPGPDTCQVGTRVWFAHTDAEKYFAAANPGNILVALGLGAELSKQGRALTFSKPVGRDRRARRKQFFHEHERSEERRVGKECVGTCSSGLSPYH